MKRPLIAILLTLSAATTALAQDWTERPYDPPIGSRWNVQIESDAVETKQDVARTMKVRSRSELTIEQKTADGYRISYVNKGVTVEGTWPGADVMGPAMSLMQGLVVRAATDASGKPTVVENLDEVKATMRAIVERSTATLQDKPQLAAMMQQLMTGMLVVDGKQAAAAYLDELPQLAAGQNTGLKPGEVRRTTEEAPSPFGGITKTVITMRIAQADTQSGKVQLVRERQLDPEAVKEFAVALVKQMGVSMDKPMPPQVIEMMKAMKFEIENRAEIDVEGGMTRSIREDTTTTVSAMGQSSVKRERKIVTVSPAS